ncbi:MAG TPA: O-antigen ligase family protein [Verrucomicrobiae bacterium]|jgi:O-antigen ligase
MRPQQLTALITLVAAVILALCLGISIATENYALLAFVATIVVICGLVVMPGYVPLFVFSLLVPFSLPVPFVWDFPVLLIGLGICAVKHWLQGGLRQRGLRKNGQNFQYHPATLPMILFMIWAFLRFCLNPSVPNAFGWGANVTGFRAWLDYALCFAILFYTGRFIGNRDGLLKTMHWIAYVSVLFIVLFVPLTLSKSTAAAEFFFRLGMFVTTFENGMLRFVALPVFGLFLIAFLLLPNLMQVGRWARIAIFAMAFSAIILGGSRTSLAMMLVIVAVIPMLRGKYLQSAIIIGSTVVLSVSVYLAGPMLSKLPQTSFMRPLALVSPDLTEASGGDANLEWREVRWQRGLDQIRKHPLIGVAYGGLENGLVSDIQSEDESQNLSLATGGVHNAYIACALALGIPAAVLFILILITQIFTNAARAIALRKTDPFLAEVHCFVCANLLAIVAAAFFASDMNDPMIWFMFALGIFTRQLRRQEFKKPAASPVFVQPVLAPA